MEQKQSFEITKIFCPGPKTIRGQGTVTQIHKNKLVYCTSDLVILRDIENFDQFEYYQGHREQVTVAKISPNGNWVCSADVKGNIHIWDAIGKDHVARHVYEKYMNGPVKDLAWTSDNQRIVAVGEGKEVFAKAFLYDTGSKVGDLNMIGKHLITVDVRGPRPFRLALAGEELTTNWYEGPPYKWKFTEKYHTSFVNCLRFSPDGNYFITVSSDRKIVLYHGKDGVKLQEFPNSHNGGIWFCDWISNTQFCTSSGDKTIKIWEVTGDNQIQQQNVMNVSENPQIPDQQVSVSSLKNTNKIISLSLGGQFNIFENSNIDLMPSKIYEQHQDIAVKLAYNLSHNLLISADRLGKIIFWDENFVGHKIQSGEGHSLEIISLELSQDEKFLYSLCKKGQIKQTEIQSKSVLKTVENDKQTLSLQVFDSNIVYALQDTQILKLKDMEISDTIQIPNTFKDVTAFGVSPNQKYICVGNQQGKLWVYDVESQSQNMYQILKYKISVVKCTDNVVISGDSQGKMTVTNIQNGEEMTNRWSYHKQMVQSLQIHNNYVISSSLDNSVIVWDLEKLEKVTDYKNIHTQQVYGCCLNLKDGSLFTSGNDCLIKKLKINQQFI